MSKLLEQASREAAKLAEEDQEALGAWLQEDLAAGRRWDKALASSPSLLTALADELWRNTGREAPSRWRPITCELLHDAALSPAWDLPTV